MQAKAKQLGAAVLMAGAADVSTVGCRLRATGRDQPRAVRGTTGAMPK